MFDDPKSEEIAALVWNHAQLEPEETIDGNTRDQFADEVQEILDQPN